MQVKGRHQILVIREIWGPPNEIDRRCWYVRWLGTERAFGRGQRRAFDGGSGKAPADRPG